jgi:hypothetical protein
VKKKAYFNSNKKETMDNIQNTENKKKKLNLDVPIELFRAIENTNIILSQIISLLSSSNCELNNIKMQVQKLLSTMNEIDFTMPNESIKEYASIFLGMSNMLNDFVISYNEYNKKMRDILEKEKVKKPELWTPNKQ